MAPWLVLLLGTGLLVLICAFDEVYDLFVKHFYWRYAWIRRLTYWLDGRRGP